VESDKLLPKRPRHISGTGFARVSTHRKENMLTRTNTHLLAALHDLSDQHAWGEFCSRYRPILVGLACRLGLPEHDAQDAAQETLMAFAEEYRQGRYERTQGRLRDWLLGIARNKIRYLQRQRAREKPVDADGGKTDAMARVPDDHDIEEAWESKWRQAILRACLAEVSRQVEPSTMQAFELISLKGWGAEQAAAHLGMSTNAVLKARRRVLARMREAYACIKENW
jgi:RNA polymerase sigma factor (sigma-70 family)